MHDGLGISYFRSAIFSSTSSRRTWTLIAALVAGLVFPARAEVDLSIFTGVALSQDSDLQLQQTGGTDLTFHDVSFEGRDFSSPPYYGARFLWFPSDASHWGFGAEFFHMKIYAETGDTVHVTGRRDGVPMDDNERIDNTIQQFSLSHGLNYALGDVVYRWLPGQRGEDFLGHLQPYAGLGLGAAIPHVESNVNGQFHEEYQLHGPGVQATRGRERRADPALGPDVRIQIYLCESRLRSTFQGGSIEVTPLTHHLVTRLHLQFLIRLWRTCSAVPVSIRARAAKQDGEASPSEVRDRVCKRTRRAESAVAMEITPLGDSALILRVGDSLGEVLATSRRLEGAQLPGV